MNLVTLSRRFLIALAGAVAVFSMIGVAHAVKQTGGEYNSMYAGLGAKGYDVVAYFTDGKAVQGKQDIEAVYGGVTWKFASEEHRDLFKADPAKYAPQYGGFCAWGVAQGKLFDVDPVNGWKIVDNKLYMNFNDQILATWNKDIPGNLAKSEANWPDLNK
ncbi:MAG TPA: YHS domain-containing (seleno)protein [Alphaproteobacteria bacterium]|nr:YHS domain-containing (seleno)protein [Alphaproteobacteria bacterium]